MSSLPNTVPLQSGPPRAVTGLISAANTNRDGTGTIVDLFDNSSAGTGDHGSKVSRLTITAIAATTAGMVRLFVHDGSNYRLYKEVQVTAITPSASTQAFTSQQTLNLELPTGWKLGASTHNAESFHLVAEGADY